MVLYHQQVTPAGGAGSYNFAHGLPYTPTCVIVSNAELADGVAPAAAQIGCWCPAGTGATNIEICVGGNGTFDILYG